MFKRIIVIAELSATSYSLIDDCAKLRTLGAEECLLIQPLIAMDSTSMDFSSVFEVLEQNLNNQKAALEELGFRVEARLLAGVTIREIADIAAKEKYSLIVVGARKRSFAGEIFLGGISAEIIHQNKAPVLVMRIGDDQQEKDEQKPKIDLTEHILFPTDFSENASLAIPYVEKMVAAGAKKVTIMHVQDKAKINGYSKEQKEKFDQEDMERMFQIKEKLQKAGDVIIDTVLTAGSPTAEILNIIPKTGVQLVIMGSQGRDYIKEIFLGSVSHNVSRHAEASVLLVPIVKEVE